MGAARRTALAVAATSLTVVAACGSSDTGSAATGDQPITQRAIAAVALDHAPTGTSSRTASTPGEDAPKGTLGADLRYGGGAGDDGGLLRVLVTPGVDDDPCGEDRYDGCEESDVAAGHLVVAWQEEEPEEDPGIVDVTLQRDDESVSVTWSGDTITGDPHRQDLEIGVDVMQAIVEDDRLGLTTAASTIEAGRALDDWDGGEPDPRALDRVASTDDSLINSYWSARGGYGAFHDRTSSPLTADFGPGAVGGRFSADAEPDSPAHTVDVLAAPAPPPWLATDPCRTEKFVGHCIEHSRNRYFAWVPGTAEEGGEVWMFQLRDDDVVAVHTSGYAVSADRRTAEIQADWFFVDSYLGSDTVGLETDREMLDLDFG